VDKRSLSLLNIQRVLSPEAIIALQPLFERTFTTEIGILPADGVKVSLMACLASSSADLIRTLQVHESHCCLVHPLSF
jgi:hypothetical protein